MIVVGFEKDKVFDTSNIQVLYLNKTRVLHAFIKIFKILVLTKPQIVFSTISHLNIMMGLQGIFFNKIKFIGREANVKSVVKNYSKTMTKKSAIWPAFTKLGYAFLDKIVCQSNDMADDMIRNYNFPKNKLEVINNPISDKLVVKKDIKPVDLIGFRFITVGRLVPQKGHLRILEALSKIDLPFTYTIIGDGSEKEKIMDYAQKLDILKKINHIPYSSEVFMHLSDNHIFLQGSYVEGFPNSLLESCAVGTPAVAFKAPGGINEIIMNEENGYIVENIDTFAEKLVYMIENLSLWPPKRVSKSVFEKYNSKRIVNKYEELFFKIAGGIN